MSTKKRKRERLRLYMDDGLVAKLDAMSLRMDVTRRQIIIGGIEHIWKLYEAEIRQEMENEDFGEYCHDSDPTFSDVDECDYREACNESPMLGDASEAVVECTGVFEAAKCDEES